MAKRNSSASLNHRVNMLGEVDELSEFTTPIDDLLEDDEVPPEDVFYDIETELDLERGGDQFESMLGGSDSDRNVGREYDKWMSECSMTTLRKLVYAKKFYTTAMKEAKRALAKSDSKTSVKKDVDYDLELRRVDREFKSKIEELSVLLLLPEQITRVENPLSATKVRRLSKAYHALVFTQKKLPFTPERNKYLMRVKKSTPTELIIRARGHSSDGRVVLAAGLAMINYYFGQEVQFPYRIQLFYGDDAIRVAGLITKHIVKKGVIEYNLLEDYVRFYWRDVVFSYQHSTLLRDDPFRMKFLFRHLLARLIFTDVLEGRLKPIKTANNNYQAGLYFTVGQKYLKNNKTFKYT